MIYVQIFATRFLSHIVKWKLLLEELGDLVLSILLPLALYGAVYSEAPEIGGKNWMQTFTYLILVEGLFHISYINEHKLRWKLNTGSFSMELLKPYSYVGKTAAEAAADLVRRLICILLPILLVIAKAEPHWFYLKYGRWTGLAALSVILGIFIRWEIQLALSVLGFWYKDIINIHFIMQTVYMILFGGMAPYWFFPSWLERLLMCTPFGYVFWLPAKLYFGDVSGKEAFFGMAAQCIWLLLFAGIIRISYRRGKRKVQKAE